MQQMASEQAMIGSGKTRCGVTLTEVLIGILILGLGVVSIASLFPVGLLRLKHAVDDTRSVQLGRSALGYIDAASVVHPPLGPVANALIADPVLGGGRIDPAQLDTRPQDGIPVVIDPLGILSRADWANVPDYPSDALPTRRFGYLVDPQGGGVVSAGLPRYRGLYLSLFQAAVAQKTGDPEQARQQARREALALFAASDDLVYWEAQTQRTMPVQVPGGTPPQFLNPTNGVPFRGGTHLREARYTWFAIVRKVNNAQFPPEAFDRVSNDDDNGDGKVVNDPNDPARDEVDVDELHWPGANGQYDADRQVGQGLETDRAVGPFHVTVVVVYRRSFGDDERAVPFVYPVGPDGVPGNPGDDNGDGVANDLDELGWPGSDDSPPNVIRVPLVWKGVQVSVPPIARGSYVCDATYLPGGARHAFWYRVTDTERTVDPYLGVPVLRITLESPLRRVVAQRNGTVQPIGALVAIRGVVGVFDTIVAQ